MWKSLTRLFQRKPPSPFLDVFLAGKRRTFFVAGSSGFLLIGWNGNERREIMRQEAVDPNQWERLWRQFNPGARIEPEDDLG